MVPSISPFPVLLKCGVVLGSLLDAGPLLSFCLRAAEMGGTVFTKLCFFSGCLFFHAVYAWHDLFGSCFVHLLSVYGVAGTFGASGFDIKCFRHSSKRYIKDGDECLILKFNTITLLVMEGDWYFAVRGCLHCWHQSQDVEDIRFLVFNFLHLCGRFITGR